jgi:proteasome lid subunit RPN8/RPN11
MHLLLTTAVLKRLRRELRRAHSREIGGLLMGEHLGGDAFRVAEITVQRAGGSAAHFVRDPAEHRASLQAFFARNGGDYARFNYLGEWHSHPIFEPLPSSVDVATMQLLVENAGVGANFLVLLVVKLAGRRTIEASATAFVARTPPTEVMLGNEQVEPSFGIGRVMPRWLRGSSVLRVRSFGEGGLLSGAVEEGGDR